MPKSRTLYSIRAASDGSNASGTCGTTGTSRFECDGWMGAYAGDTPAAPLYIRIPVGLSAKIFDVTVDGVGEVTFNIQHNYDVTGGAWVTLDEYRLAAEGHIHTPKENRPEIRPSRDGKQGIRITWSQSSAALAYLHFQLELSDDE